MALVVPLEPGDLVVVQDNLDKATDFYIVLEYQVSKTGSRYAEVFDLNDEVYSRMYFHTWGKYINVRVYRDGMSIA